MVDDFDTLDFGIYVGDAVTGDAEQNMGFSEAKSTQDWNKFDKALAKKRVDAIIINQAKSCDYVTCKNQMGQSFGVIPLGNLQVYDSPERKKMTFV